LVRQRDALIFQLLFPVPNSSFKSVSIPKTPKELEKFEAGEVDCQLISDDDDGE